MKSLALILFLFIAFDSNAQQFKFIHGELIIDTVANSDNSKLELFSNTVGFISTYFKNTKATIDVKDIELGELVFSGNLIGFYTSKVTNVVNKKGKKEPDSTRELPLKVGFTCHLYLKDNKFKVILKKFDTVSSLLYSYGETSSFPFHEGVLVSEDEDDLHALALIREFLKTLTVSLNSKPENDF